MKNYEIWIRTVISIVFVVLVVQWGWNQFFPLFGLPELNILQATGLFIMMYFVVMIVSIAWNSHKPTVQHFHYDVDGDQPEGQTK